MKTKCVPSWIGKGSNKKETGKSSYSNLSINLQIDTNKYEFLGVLYMVDFELFSTLANYTSYFLYHHQPFKVEKIYEKRGKAKENKFLLCEDIIWGIRIRSS